MSNRAWLRSATSLLAAATVAASLAVAHGTVPQQASPGASRPSTSIKPVRAKAPTPADNSYCLVCHANLKNEPLAHKHQRVGVGCRTCHGESDKHSSDENNVTPPDIMYSKARIAGACATCHAPAGLLRTDRRLRLPLHARSLAPSGATPKYCTDCHGAHRLPVRTRRWDKDTGKLIKDDGVRMTSP